MNTFVVLQQMIVLFLMIVMGYAANHFGIMGKESERWLSKLIVNITCPALILSSVTTSARLESTAALLMIFAAAAVYYLVLPLVSKLIVKLLRIPCERAAEYESLLVYSNIGFMGIPVAKAILGQDSILYLSIFMAVFNISVFSYGTILLQVNHSGEKQKIPFKKMINPGTVTSAVAILLYVLGIRLPELVISPITSVGGITTPLAMLVIGSSLANQPLREVLSELNMLPFTVIRLLILPLVSIVLCRWLIADPMLAGILVLVSAMPSASNIVMLSHELGRDPSYISKGIFFSTVFSVITIPLVAMLMNQFL